MKIEIESKYNKGDRFFCAFNVRKKCPHCKRYYPHYEVAEIEITDVSFNGIYVYYRVTVYISKNAQFSTSYVSEDKFYKTRKEAQVCCDQYNKRFMEAKTNNFNDPIFTELV